MEEVTSLYAKKAAITLAYQRMQGSGTEKIAYMTMLREAIMVMT